MNLSEILERVDAERLYQHVARLEGVRHPLDTPQALDVAADYLHTEMASYGIGVREQVFRVDGFDGAFRNIEGWVGDEAAPAAVIISHYDTVWNDPGANDNGAGVAVTLEAARVLAGVPDAPPVRFVCASLEEGNPVIEARLRQAAQRYGLHDGRRRYTSHTIARLLKQHNALYLAARSAGKPRAAAYAEAEEKIGDAPESVRAYLAEVRAVYSERSDADQTGWLNKIGSSAWVDEARALGKRLKFAVSVDEAGTVSQRPGSQTLPPGIGYEMFQTYKVDKERAIGDWVLAVGDQASGALLDSFRAQCMNPAIDLPVAAAHLPLAYADIAQQMPMALGSDHAPFWRAGIPALLVFDTSDWRNPFTHCMADTIDKVDFDQLAKVCKAVAATVLDPALRKE
jgi:hypothetical protein